MFLRAGFSFFSKSNFAFDLYHTENMCWFVGNEIGSFELCVRKSSDFRLAKNIKPAKTVDLTAKNAKSFCIL